jgi:signal peptidase I
MRLRNALRAVRDPLLILGIMLLARTAIAEPFYIPSGSMEPTLQIGDEILTTKFSYGYSLASLPFGTAPKSAERLLGSPPDRGDIVVFRWPGDPSQHWVKRVIGLPGDRIALHGGQVWINGAAAPLAPVAQGGEEEDDGTLVPATRMIETLPNGRAHAIWKLEGPQARDEMAEITVPAGMLFVMGDNRDRSADSRIRVEGGGVGLLPIGNVLGRAAGIIGSVDIAAAKDQPVTRWPESLRLDRFFSRVR